MYLAVNNKTSNKFPTGTENYLYLLRLREPADIVRPDRVRVGGCYLYKEKHGMVCIVKIVEDTSKGDWIGYRLMVKRVLFSHWHVPKHCVFEAGYNEAAGCPSSWHLEPVMELVETKAV